MSSSPSPHSANKAAILLLRIAFVLNGTLSCMFVIVQLGASLPHGRSLLLAAALLGGAAILFGLSKLFREVSTPLQHPKRPLRG
ncbi:MAG: hypothetical protein K0S46_569 [Moraxellaceae bacterium]|jgi:hypothetical protein|nr:hypothetical protein [Moraxellaceae bacterium]